MRRLNKPIELPEVGEGDLEYPAAMRSLVSYTLSPDARNRPSFRDVLEHEYLRGTEESHPTKSLAELVNIYYGWLVAGGQRTSLFIKGGAPVSDPPGSLITPDEEWNFSTTAGFERRASTIFNIPEVLESPETLALGGDVTPKALTQARLPSEELSTTEKANFEERVRRGADLAKIFDQSKPQYEYKAKTDFVPIQDRRVSDLPFRAMAEDRPSSIASNVLYLDDFESSNYATVQPTNLVDAATFRKRGDSKIYRESSNADPHAGERGTIAEEPLSETRSMGDRPDTQVFSFPPQEWKQKQEASESSINKSSSRKTLDWSFDQAMSDVEQAEQTERSEAVDTKAKKHATLEWSFSDAMAEAGSKSPENLKRPGPPLRTTTLPVLSSEFDADEVEYPRPSTATSEARSTTSLAGSEVDPFSLDKGVPGYPVPSALDQRGISSYYAANEGSILGEPTIPSLTYSIPGGPGPYGLGAPARIGESGFPGPNTGIDTAVPTVGGAKKQKKKKGKAGNGNKMDSVSGEIIVDQGSVSSAPTSPTSTGTTPPEKRAIPGRKVTLPDISPPPPAVLDANADPEVVAQELGKSLSSFGQFLGAVGKVFDPRKVGKKEKTRKGRKGSSEEEWLSEE